MPAARNFPPLRLLIGIGVALLTLDISVAADTDIANQPLATQSPVKAKPNLLFILDDSGSMEREYMPDDMSNTGTRGYRSAQCNGLAYDPSLTYSPPVMADGTPYANASFSDALDDGYNSSSDRVNLENSRYYRYTGTQPRLGWTYTSSGVVRNDFYNECQTSTNTNTASEALFPRVTVTSTSSEAQNYANWYSYYRKRYLLMRTAVGRAVAPLDASYRVGFSRINKPTITDGNDFRDVRDFDSTQKARFYSSLYAAEPNNYTPLRRALSKAGRYFAMKESGQSYDPVQYSCQRNFALLTTDGYWNSSYGIDLDGNNVGQRDGADARPMRDDSSYSEATVVRYTAPATRYETAYTRKERYHTKTRTKVAGSTGGGCNWNRYLVTTERQRLTDVEETSIVTPQAGLAYYTVTTTNTGTGTPTTVTSPTEYESWRNAGAATQTGPIETAGSTWVTTSSTSCQSSKGNNTWSDWSAEQVSVWAIAQDPSPQISQSAPQVGPFTAGDPILTPTSTGGTPNTLADVAQYYYKTDLRSASLNNCMNQGVNVCGNIVPDDDGNGANWQRMNTYTIGMGVNGTLPYDREYLTQTTGAFAEIKAGTRNWPRPDGYNNTNIGGDATNVDDLWHAAVNGRGRYYSALDASSLSQAIKGVIDKVDAAPGAAAAAATSSVDLVDDESNRVFRASYTTVEWTGDVQAFSMAGDGTIGSTPVWSAQQQLGTVAPAARNILVAGTGTSGLTPFTYAAMDATQRAHFANMCDKVGQCLDLNDAAKITANSAENLVNYLRGVRTLEGTHYRVRTGILGDIINGAPVLVGKPPFNYGDSGYADYVATKNTRKQMVYAAANDGMLHAISASGTDAGSELWAFIPTGVLPKMYKLAGKKYGEAHEYFVDGAPVVADIKVGTTWKTILVGGLGAGGKSYYALDITTPESPALLWEFTDVNLGLTFGNPVVGKRPSDGKWIVTFASGYNNNTGGGDGVGRLYVLDAATGQPVVSGANGVATASIATTGGSTANPSGLAKINAWTTSRTNNTIERIYGADLQGNLWRFDYDNQVAPNVSALLLAQLRSSTGAAQPVTTKPELAKIENKPVVIVSTGRYLGHSDVTDTATQSIYAIKDNLTTTGWGNVRANTTDFVKQTLTLSETGTSASITDHPVDWTTKGGWWLDLPHAGERVNTNMGLLSGMLMVATAIPNGDACAIGGSSWYYVLDAINGGVVTNSVPAGAQWSADSLIVGQTQLRDASGNRKNLIVDSKGRMTTTSLQGSSSGVGSVRRVSWRELIK